MESEAQTTLFVRKSAASERTEGKGRKRRGKSKERTSEAADAAADDDVSEHSQRKRAEENRRRVGEEEGSLRSLQNPALRHPPPPPTSTSTARWLRHRLRHESASGARFGRRRELFCFFFFCWRLASVCTQSPHPTADPPMAFQMPFLEQRGGKEQEHGIRTEHYARTCV